MAIRQILTEPNKILRQKSLKVDVVNEEIQKLMDDMLETMYAAPGIGLAAIQVGVPKRVIVLDIARKEEPKKPMYFINPEIINETGDDFVYPEGCLSIPNISENIVRKEKLKIKFLDENLESQKMKCSGIIARVIQHEYDHLNGILYTSRLADKKAFGYSEEIEKYWKENNEKTSK